MSLKINRVLIANRGEIALRIQHACDALGLESVTICSEADRALPFAKQAKKLVVIGPAAAKESYLAIDKIIAAAREHACEAVHPGYGFLSENADFADAVAKAGFIFIGPSANAIRTLGSKTAARAKVQERGVPTTPGSPGGLSDDALIQHAERIGYPVIAKAVGGGGGRGMRVMHSAAEMRELLPRARAEAKKNFSCEDVYIEKYIDRPRHVEVQIFGDSHGNVIHLGTRDCSSQRRHQKLIEEAPAPGLSPALRERIHTAAVEAARSVGYENAGTAEFLVDGDRCYFLEMNTRIQVEHPVTEAVTGLDLVALQIRVARGEPLPVTQSEVKFRGHAMEFRIYAEDTTRGFLPQIGKISRIDRMKAPFLREDFGFESGDEVSPHYDAMLSKLIVSGESRAAVLDHALELFSRYRVHGLPTSIPFHQWMITNNDFRRGPVDIGYVDRVFDKEAASAIAAVFNGSAAHRTGAFGGTIVEHIQLSEPSARIELRHLPNGFFVAAPCCNDGSMPHPSRCRMSNSPEAAIRALVEEVLRS